MRDMRSAVGDKKPTVLHPTGPLPGPDQLRLDLPGVPESTATDVVKPEDFVLDMDVLEQYKPGPEMRTLFDATDALFDGLDWDQSVEAQHTLYLDGDGNPRARSLNTLHSVR